jgi:hypothetical protein
MRKKGEYKKIVWKVNEKEYEKSNSIGRIEKYRLKNGEKEKWYRFGKMRDECKRYWKVKWEICGFEK